MIRTHIIPESNNLQVIIPDNYVGKKVEVTVVSEEEMEDGTNPKAEDISKFEGILSKERANEFQKFAEQIRNEWQRD